MGLQKPVILLVCCVLFCFGQSDTLDLLEDCSVIDDVLLTCTEIDYFNPDVGQLILDDTRSLVLKDIKNATLSSVKRFKKKYALLEHFELTRAEFLDVEEYAFKGFNNLKTIKLYNNTWHEIKEGAFAGLNKLEKLNLTNNGLDILHPGSFKGLRQLEVLQLTRNKLTSLPSNIFGDLSKLKKLYLDHNRISVIAHDSFYGIPKLTSMFLTNNTLTTVNAEDFNVIRHLENLYLDFNKIETISGSFNLTKLKYIKLNDNALSNLSDNVFGNATRHVKKIDLYNNYLENLTEAPFLRLTKLKNLNLIGNRAAIANFEQLSKQTTIIME